ncbi:MAG: helix-turn-helix transcriptional regulator [Herpetosiphonaceae bacterium]|nr:helix-turn-helix transcriptional regulator [Herpetosiphonaceae bacterium]
MIITLPSHALYPYQAGAPRSASYILHERAPAFHAAGTGSLSIKCFFAGQAVYEIGRGRYTVDDRSYLVVNDQQPYVVSIDSPTAVESFCIFYEAGFAEAVQRSLLTPTDRLILEPDLPMVQPLTFFERTYPHDHLLSPAIFQLRLLLHERPVEQGWLLEQLHTIMERLLQLHHHVATEVALIPAVRAATRAELYRCLHRARDYAASCFDQPITLNDLAFVAGLSPNHLLRTFKQLFHQTPYQYLTLQRLNHAQHLLQRTDRSVTDICAAVGFESLGSFSWLFRRHIGMSPATYRRQSR